MYAIRHKKTKKFVYGTDYRQYYNGTKTHKQRTSSNQALTYADKDYAEIDMLTRGMSKDYEIVEVKLVVKVIDNEIT